MTPWHKSVGKRIAAGRLARGWTQEGAAVKVGVSPSTYQRYESGAIVPPLNMFAMLCEVFGVSADMLLARDAFVPRTIKPPSLSPVAQRIQRSLATTHPRVLEAMRRVQGLAG